jgi:hypothetical protein
MEPTPYFVLILLHYNRQIYRYSSGNVSPNTYINLLEAKNWEENEGNTAICMLAVADSEHTRHKQRQGGPGNRHDTNDGC